MEFRATSYNGTGTTPAEQQYRRFSHLAPQKNLRGSVRYPERVKVAAYASAIGYRSDKFNGQWTDYIHEFGPMHPEVWVESKSKTKGILFPKTWKHQSFAMLGFLLDLQIYRRTEDRIYYDFTFPRKGAVLCGDGVSHRLYIIPIDPNDGTIVVLQSPYLRIMPAGITN